MIANVKPFLLSVYVVDDDVCRAAGREEEDQCEGGDEGGCIDRRKVGTKGRWGR